MAQAAVKVPEEQAETKAKKVKAEKPAADIVKVDPKAMQVDIGPKVVALFDRSAQADATALDHIDRAKNLKYDAISTLTLAIINAAKADKGIDLSAAFSGDRKAMEKLNDQIGLAIGLKEIVTTVDGDKKVQRVVVAKSVAKYFPSAKDDKDSPEYKRKNTFRANFATQIKTCAQAAEGIIQTGVVVTMDNQAHTLKLSGPKVVEHFGQDNVLLNENASQKGDDAKLKVKPSFAELRALGGEKHDAEVKRGSNTRGTQISAAQPKTPTDPDTALSSLCYSLIQGLGKYEGDLSAKVKDSLAMVMNAISARLKQ